MYTIVNDRVGQREPERPYQAEFQTWDRVCWNSPNEVPTRR